jgi:hypothetical protein
MGAIDSFRTRAADYAALNALVYGTDAVAACESCGGPCSPDDERVCDDCYLADVSLSPEESIARYRAEAAELRAAAADTDSFEQSRTFRVQADALVPGFDPFAAIR